MKEFIEKLIERLEEEKYTREEKFLYDTRMQENMSSYNKGLNMAIRTVNQLAEEYKDKTNADRIRSMSDEELAEFLRKTVWEEGANLFDCADYICDYPCSECKAYLKWLQSEAE